MIPLNKNAPSSSKFPQFPSFSMNQVLDFYNTYVVPYLSSLGRHQQNHRRLSIAAAVCVTTCFLIYERLVLPPRYLRAVPRASFFGYVRSLIMKWPMYERYKRYTLPAIEASNGIYARYDNVGWTAAIVQPDLAKTFLLKTDIFPKIDNRQRFKDTLAGRYLFGPNIIFLNHDHWKKHRKIANPAFHRSMPVELFGRLTHKLFKVIDSSPDGRVDFGDLVTRWTLDAIGLSGFGFDFNAVEDENSPWVQKYHKFSGQTFNPLFFFLPILDRKLLWLLRERKRAHEDLTEFLSMLDEVIARKRRVLKANKESLKHIKDNEKDLLTLLIESGEDDSENALSDEELKSNVCAFFLAGHDTTASALSFATYYLAAHPDIQEKARQEAIRVFGDDPVDILPTVEQTKELDYINMVIKENLRINGPAISVVARYAAEDTELGGVFIPKGTRMVLDIYGLHHNPKVWKDPSKFDPDRFLPGGEAEQLARQGMAWIPFSNGARQCIGMNFSLAEQRVLLPFLLRKYEWTLPQDTIHKNGVVTSGSGINRPVMLNVQFKRRY